MSKWDKVYTDVMSGMRDANIRFADLKGLVERLGFSERIRGSHHIFEKQECAPINLQPEKGNAKSYQVRQVRRILKERGV